MSWVQTVEKKGILKNNSGGKNPVGNMLVRKFSFAPTEAKTHLSKSYCYPIDGCALWRHSYQNSISKLTVSYSDTFTRLINVRRHSSSSLAFAMIATDHINVVFCKSACSLMSRETASSNSIVTAIVNSDAYQQSALMDKYIICIRIGRIIFQYVKVWRMTVINLYKSRMTIVLKLSG